MINTWNISNLMEMKESSPEIQASAALSLSHSCGGGCSSNDVTQAAVATGGGGGGGSEHKGAKRRQDVRAKSSAGHNDASASDSSGQLRREETRPAPRPLSSVQCLASGLQQDGMRTKLNHVAGRKMDIVDCNFVPASITMGITNSVNSRTSEYDRRRVKGDKKVSKLSKRIQRKYDKKSLMSYVRLRQLRQQTRLQQHQYGSGKQSVKHTTWGTNRKRASAAPYATGACSAESGTNNNSTSTGLYTNNNKQLIVKADATTSNSGALLIDKTLSSLDENLREKRGSKGYGDLQETPASSAAAVRDCCAEVQCDNNVVEQESTESDTAYSSMQAGVSDEHRMVDHPLSAAIAPGKVGLGVEEVVREPQPSRLPLLSPDVSFSSATASSTVSVVTKAPNGETSSCQTLTQPSLGLQRDPSLWSCHQVQQWLGCMVHEYYRKHLSTFTVDGALLCILSKDQIRHRIPDFREFMSEALSTLKDENCPRTEVSSTRQDSPQSLKNDHEEQPMEILSVTKKEHDSPSHLKERNNNMIKPMDNGHSKREAMPRNWSRDDSIELQTHISTCRYTAGSISGSNSLDLNGHMDETPNEYLNSNAQDSVRFEHKVCNKSVISEDEDHATSQPLDLSLNKTSVDVDRDSGLDLSTKSKFRSHSQYETNSLSPDRGYKNLIERRKYDEKEKRKLRLTIRPRTNEHNDPLSQHTPTPFEDLYDTKTVKSAPVIANAYSRGYQDAAALSRQILLSKMTKIPHSFFSNMINSPGSVPGSPLTPLFSPHKAPFHDRSPLKTNECADEPQPIIVAPCGSPVLSASQSSHINSSIPVQVKQEKDETYTNKSLLQIPTPVFRTPSPRSPRMSRSPQKYSSNLFRERSPLARSPSPKQKSPSPLHDTQQVPSTSSSPTHEQCSDHLRCKDIPAPSSSSALIHRLLLHRSFSMPMGPGVSKDYETPIPKPHVMPTTPVSSNNKDGLLMIHPLAGMTSGGVSSNRSQPGFHRQVSQASNTTGQGGSSGSFSPISSADGDSDQNDTEHPFSNAINHANSLGNFPQAMMPNASSQFAESPTPASPSRTTTGYNRSGRIKLWEFLLEILTEQKHDCIVWLNMQQGIFKITNSEQVAILWGQRKGLPSMNYDKLSRSIRQYYKQGIIKKTEDSKRLVYQFHLNYIQMFLSRKLKV